MRRPPIQSIAGTFGQHMRGVRQHHDFNADEIDALVAEGVRLSP